MICYCFEESLFLLKTGRNLFFNIQVMQHTHYCTENLYGSGGVELQLNSVEAGTSLSHYIIGIGNCSETFYIRSFVHYLLSNGHNVAVLNHVGTLRDVPVTGNRLLKTR